MLALHSHVCPGHNGHLHMGTTMVYSYLLLPAQSSDGSYALKEKNTVD